jgi:hypothetical protein
MASLTGGLDRCMVTDNDIRKVSDDDLRVWVFAIEQRLAALEAKVLPSPSRAAAVVGDLNDRISYLEAKIEQPHVRDNMGFDRKDVAEFVKSLPKNSTFTVKKYDPPAKK